MFKQSPVVCEQLYRGRQLIGSSRFNDYSGLAIPHGFRDPADISRDDWQRGGHSLQYDVRKGV
jgi:hypothetical protein